MVGNGISKPSTVESLNILEKTTWALRTFLLTFEPTVPKIVFWINQGGPTSCRVISPLIGVITPVKYIDLRPLVWIPFILGPSLMGEAPGSLSYAQSSSDTWRIIPGLVSVVRMGPPFPSHEFRPCREGVPQPDVRGLSNYIYLFTIPSPGSPSSKQITSNDRGMRYWLNLTDPSKPCFVWRGLGVTQSCELPEAPLEDGQSLVWVSWM